jgi:hypothetical protein
MVRHNESMMGLVRWQNPLKRWFLAYPYRMLLPNVAFGLHSIVSLASIVPGLFLLKMDRFRLLGLWAALPWLYLNFGSSSLSSYIALPVAPRYLEFVYPPLFLLTGAVIDRAAARKGMAPFLILAVAVALVATVGFWCGFTTRGQGFRTDEVAVLRVIAERAREQHLSSIGFVEDPKGLWKPAMAILAPDLNYPSDPLAADLVIRPDAFGLPSVAQKPGTAAEGDQSTRSREPPLN